MIVRSKRSKHFTVIDNGVLEDDRISFRAKGVLTFLLSKPDNWKVGERHLARVGHEGVTAIRAALKELELAGYIERRRMHSDDGRFEWESVVFDTPRTAISDDTPCSENRSTEEQPCLENHSMDSSPCLGFPCVEKPCVDNRAQTNTVVTSTDLTITHSHTPEQPVPSHASDIQPVELIAVTTSKKAVKLKAKGPHMPAGLRLPGGYVAAGQGENAVQVYYERFSYANPDAHLNRPQEDDLVRLCPDLSKLREVITAYSRTNYRPGNIQLIIDWYRNGIPAQGRSSKSAGYGRHERGGTSPRKGGTADAIDPEMAEFLASFVDARDGSRAISAD